MTRTEAAKMNLRKGIKKMGKVMSPAATVRRDFRLGRPPKPGESLPLHRLTVWQRATEALANLRARMSAAKLNPEHVKAAIVYYQPPDTNPHLLLLESEQRTDEQCKMDAFETLGRDDVFAIGMVFDQYDELSGQQITFPFQFTGLTEDMIVSLRLAAELPHGLAGLARIVN